MTACTCHECTLLRDARERVLDLDGQRQALLEENAVLRKTLDDASYEDGDHLPKQLRNMFEMFHGELCALREKVPKLEAALTRALGMVSDGWRDEPEYESLCAMVKHDT